MCESWICHRRLSFRNRCKKASFFSATHELCLFINFRSAYWWPKIWSTFNSNIHLWKSFNGRGIVHLFGDWPGFWSVWVVTKFRSNWAKEFHQSCKESILPPVEASSAYPTCFTSSFSFLIKNILATCFGIAKGSPWVVPSLDALISPFTKRFDSDLYMVLHQHRFCHISPSNVPNTNGSDSSILFEGDFFTNGDQKGSKGS